jgi:hypothetical protein
MKITIRHFTDSCVILERVHINPDAQDDIPMLGVLLTRHYEWLQDIKRNKFSLHRSLYVGIRSVHPCLCSCST